jgi:predicted metalloprotease
MLRGRESTNIEDRRGMGGIAAGGGGIGVLILALVIYLCGGDPSTLLNQIGGGGDTTQVEQPQQQQNNTRNNDDQKRFVASVLGSTEDVWNKVLPQQARTRYRNPTLVLFENQVQSACGRAGSATGPFYCGGDEKLYLDFSFFRDLKTEFKADGDFAQAYVIAHEVGHHVQKILGTMQKVNDAGNSNALSVKLELQADCYAGVWAYYADKQGLVEAGDAEEAIRAAQAVGDDAIQKQTQGYIVPDSFTHGSSRDRMAWFTRGFKAGDMRQCDTFGR